ncbi:glycosyltransferase family 2 protein [Microbacterium sp. LMI1-1-1.1]|uniref:glycosyltransferase family 2 protein n=1 Tax=Microbacterium sp. LMI1-1-1.1 TaxID=3135223 RepID=UPI00346611D6
MSTTGGTARIDVVVPVYGGWAHVEECLRSLRAQTSPVNVFVVDDVSPDDTPDRVAREFPEVTLLRNRVNSGFATSCNHGIRAGAAPYVVLLNSDVIAEPSMAADLLATFDAADERTGSVSPVLSDREGNVDAFGTCADVTLAGYVRWHGVSSLPADAARRAPVNLGPYGALAAYRRAALDDVGLLDENIFMYGEELELSLRLAAGGWTSLPLPRVLGSHIGGASAGVESPRQRYLSAFGRAYTLRVYDVLRSRHAARTVLTELVVVGARLVLRRDVASLRGRVAGWRAGRGVPHRRRPSTGLDRGITFTQSLRMRGDGFWQGLAAAPSGTDGDGRSVTPQA